MIILDMPQLSDEWFAARAGNPGASNFKKIVTSKGEPSKQATDYLYELAAEAIKKVNHPSYKSDYMQEGSDREGESRGVYEMIKDVVVKEVGIVFPDEQKKYHCSPDGIIECSVPKPYGLEMKNPLPKTQVKYLLSGKLPTEYIPQVQGSMLVTGYDRWDFMSYSPGLPPLIIKVERDDKFINKLEKELDKFCYALAATIQELKAK
jgi:hypothetical protein